MLERFVVQLTTRQLERLADNIEQRPLQPDGTVAPPPPATAAQTAAVLTAGTGSAQQMAAAQRTAAATGVQRARGGKLTVAGSAATGAAPRVGGDRHSHVNGVALGGSNTGFGGSSSSSSSSSSNSSRARSRRAADSAALPSRFRQ